MFQFIQEIFSFEKTLDKEFERKNVSPVIHSIAKIYSLELKQIQEGNFSKIAKEKGRKFKFNIGGTLSLVDFLVGK